MASAQPGGPEADPAVEALRRHGVPASAGNLPVLRDEVDGWARAAGLGDEIVESLALATYEAMANAVEHAYADGDGVFDLDAVRDPSGIEITVTDHGSWRPPQDSDPLRQRGLPLIERLADEAVVTSGQRGTRVQMRWAVPTRRDDVTTADA
ncbi:ATP-binding protein [Saccharopolyspora flava]|uniref:Anti-sigma regulatory factor (Ser/Thr protein kinase) n=1 Tax=Saccharopolyspora flava TaxID=95161 RepID=A0A1I6U8H5_9PSEU|nr:ATP-binding protein [Saccharopolyspora flava]SFS97577.1 Anti-sigma regulatory factor (Ser/Thr protein kinase) [Saccharopolyspora flava]